MHKKRVLGLIIVILFMFFLLLVKEKIDRWAGARAGVPYSSN